MQLTKLKISDLTQHPDNYNEHPESQISELQSSLDMFGQFKNIVVAKGVIVCGHGLVEAAKQRGDTEIYALVRDDLSEDEIKAMLIADNETARLSIPNLGKLEYIKLSLPDIVIPGVSYQEIETPEFKEFDENITNDIKKCKCEKCGHEHSAKKN